MSSPRPPAPRAAHLCRLNTVQKARDEILSLARLAGYTGADPDMAATALRARLTSQGQPAATPAGRSRRDALWAEYRALPVERRNAFYLANKSILQEGEK